MTSLDAIKLKLRKFFVTSLVSPDDIPLRIFQKDKKLIYQYKKKKTGEIWASSSEDGFNFNLTGHAEKEERDENLPLAVAIPGRKKNKKESSIFR
ncbi:hypothetical protein IPM65_01340 [Candidatus Roizmanbacteria bacterium]|nr:MAG: hypothetical protein IPM65_01340 [Candidatus Roizmanbacteria bacterium]